MFDCQFQSPNFVGLSSTEIQFDWIRLSNNAGITMHAEQNPEGKLINYRENTVCLIIFILGESRAVSPDCFQ